MYSRRSVLLCTISMNSATLYYNKFYLTIRVLFSLTSPPCSYVTQTTYGLVCKCWQDGSTAQLLLNLNVTFVGYVSSVSHSC